MCCKVTILQKLQQSPPECWTLDQHGRVEAQNAFSKVLHLAEEGGEQDKDLSMYRHLHSNIPPHDLDKSFDDCSPEHFIVYCNLEGLAEHACCQHHPSDNAHHTSAMERLNFQKRDEYNTL